MAGTSKSLIWLTASGGTDTRARPSAYESRYSEPDVRTNCGICVSIVPPPSHGVYGPHERYEKNPPAIFEIVSRGALSLPMAGAFATSLRRLHPVKSPIVTVDWKNPMPIANRPTDKTPEARPNPAPIVTSAKRGMERFMGMNRSVKMRRMASRTTNTPTSTRPLEYSPAELLSMRYDNGSHTPKAIAPEVTTQRKWTNALNAPLLDHQ